MLALFRNTSKIKLVLAGAGVITLVYGAALGASLLITYEPSPQVSELALHPERQDEIVSRREADRYREALGLSPEQTDKIFEILLEDRGRRKSLTKGEIDPQMMMERMQLRDELTAAIRAVLSPEQLAAFNEMPEGRRDQFMNGMRNMSPEQREEFRRQMQERMGSNAGPGFGPGFGPGRDGDNPFRP